MKPVSFVDFCTSVLRVQLTAAQRVLAAVSFDDVDPADLEGQDRDLARELFGEVDHVPSEARLVVAWLKGSRIGGSWMCALYLLWRALVADLSGLAAGEVAFAPAVAPDAKTARQSLRYAKGAALSVPSIAKLVTANRSDSFTVKRPDGGQVAIEVFAASRGGASVRGRTMVAGLMDESSFFRDPDSGVVNDSELFRAMAPRILPGGKLAVISTPWMEAGLLWDLVQKNHGTPSSALAAIAPTLTVRSDSQQLRRIVEDERARDPENAAREFDCTPFAQGAGAFFDASAIGMAMDASLPLMLTPVAGQVAVLGVDVAFRKDATGGVVVRRHRDVFEVCELLEIRPPRGGHLKPSSVVGQLAAMGQRHRAQHAAADQHYIETVREHVRGLSLEAAPGGITGKIEVYTLARTLLNEGRVRIPAGHVRLAAQLREVVSRPTPGGGMTITSPRKRGGHGDLVSALVLALWLASRHGGPFRIDVPEVARSTNGVGRAARPLSTRDPFERRERELKSRRGLRWLL